MLSEQVFSISMGREELLEAASELLLASVLELLERESDAEELKRVSAALLSAEELLGFFPDEEETSEVSVAEVSVPVVSPTIPHSPSSQK